METEESFAIEDRPPPGVDPAARWVIMGMVGLLVAGGLAYTVLRTPPPPPSPEVMKDPLLLEGRNIYMARCATCHGVDGRGDGPIARDLLGPPVGDIRDGKWKHGNHPDDVYNVIAKGVNGTRMAGWADALETSQLRAVTAFVLYLAGQRIPDQLRQFDP